MYLIGKPDGKGGNYWALYTDYPWWRSASHKPDDVTCIQLKAEDKDLTLEEAIEKYASGCGNNHIGTTSIVPKKTEIPYNVVKPYIGFVVPFISKEDFDKLIDANWAHSTVSSFIYLAIARSRQVPTNRSQWLALRGLAKYWFRFLWDMGDSRGQATCLAKLYTLLSTEEIAWIKTCPHGSNYDECLDCEKLTTTEKGYVS